MQLKLIGHAWNVTRFSPYLRLDVPFPPIDEWYKLVIQVLEWPLTFEVIIYSYAKEIKYMIITRCFDAYKKHLTSNYSIKYRQQYRISKLLNCACVGWRHICFEQYKVVFENTVHCTTRVLGKHIFHQLY